MQSVQITAVMADWWRFQATFEMMGQKWELEGGQLQLADSMVLLTGVMTVLPLGGSHGELLFATRLHLHRNWTRPSSNLYKYKTIYLDNSSPQMALIQVKGLNKIAQIYHLNSAAAFRLWGNTHISRCVGQGWERKLSKTQCFMQETNQFQ